MRRKDREITDKEKIRQIVESCYCCRIGFCDEGQVYIVPLNFGYVIRQEQYTFYFHSAKEGRKIDLIQKNPHVGIELDTGGQLIVSDLACGCSTRYQSIIANGILHMVTDPAEKEAGLLSILEHTTGKRDWHFDHAMLQAVNVFKADITNLSCKEHE